MKILFLSQGKKISDHPGWNDALVKLQEEGYIESYLNIPYFGYAEKYGWESFYEHIYELAKKEHFDMIYFHYFHSQKIPSPIKCINRLRTLDSNPIIITSAGDGFSDNWMRVDYPQCFKDISQLADITFSTQMGKAADKMMNWGSRNIVYTPNSMCQVRFGAHSIELDNHDFEYDVVFIGSNNGNRFFNPISKHWWGAKKRNKLVKALNSQYGKRFGLFGKGWNNSSAQGSIPFDEQQTAYRKGRIVVGGNPYSYSDYYSSNRLFFEVASGVPTVELMVPRLDKVLRKDNHVYYANDIEDIIKICDRLLKSDTERLYEKAAEAAKYIEEKHTQYHRMKFKIDTVRHYKENNGKLDDLFLPYFLTEVNLGTERSYAIRQSGE